MIKDALLVKAVAGILQRSEKQQDLQKLVGTFVDVGILPQIDNINNQIIYGRRGTGKTHILRVLASALRMNDANAVVYIDARTLGSTNQFTDTNVSLKQRCLALFRDVFVEMHITLLNHIVYQPSATAGLALESLDELSKVMLEPVTRYTPETVVSRSLNKATDQDSAGVSINIQNGPSLKLEGTSNSSVEKEGTTSFRAQSDDKVMFPDVVNLLADVLQKTQARLFILLDEWSSIPIELQPYLAEFIRRGFLPCPDVVIKIASLEYRSNFVLRQSSGGIVGFELGADISTAVDIDDYYVYDRNTARVTSAFSDMLYKHIDIEMPEDHMASNYGIKSGSELASKMFTSKIVFEELVRASEGVARDLINIFNKAFFDAQRRDVSKIDRKAILEGARQWFEQDKENSLDIELRKALKKIVEEVIGHRRARSFMLPRELEKNSIVQRLFDARVLHLMQRGYADKDNPGTRYNIYTLDYGTYVDLINTSRQPEINFMDGDAGSSDDFVVPFDDKRSIRRIVLSEQNLS